MGTSKPALTPARWSALIKTTATHKNDPVSPSKAALDQARADAAVSAAFFRDTPVPATKDPAPHVGGHIQSRRHSSLFQHPFSKFYTAAELMLHLCYGYDSLQLAAGRVYEAINATLADQHLVCNPNHWYSADE